MSFQAPQRQTLELHQRRHQVCGAFAPTSTHFQNHLRSRRRLERVRWPVPGGGWRAQLLQWLAVVGKAAHGIVRAESVDVDTQRLLNQSQS